MSGDGLTISRSVVAAGAVLGLALAACSGQVPASRTSGPTSGPPMSPAVTSTPSAPLAAQPTCGNPTASLRPQGTLPAPGALPAGSYEKAIADRGRLVVGVSQDDMLFGYLNPFTNQVEGFDIDILKQVSRAIFGEDGHIEYHLLTPTQRIPALQSGSVDIVGLAFTMNCARWQQIDFSTEYFDSGQRLMVPATSSIQGLQDLGGKRVCTPAGTTSEDRLRHAAGHPVPVLVSDHTDCLVKLQGNEVDAVWDDESVLRGLAAQDPTLRLVGPRLTDEPYGLGISQAHPDFVRFVNAVLDKIRADGSWAAIYARWLSRFGPAPAPPPAAYQD